MADKNKTQKINSKNSQSNQQNSQKGQNKSTKIVVNLKENDKSTGDKDLKKKVIPHYQKFSEKLFKYDIDGYMKSFILPTKDKLMATCKYCDKKGEEPFLAQQVINHVHTKVHLENTPENERETKLKMLQDSINEGKQRLKTSNLAWKNKSKDQKSEEESKEYLEFISYCLSERLSFLQISKIGTFLKQMISRIEGSKLNFFSTHSFNKDIISNITTNCFGKYCKTPGLIRFF